jgi:hypothetical protein
MSSDPIGDLFREPTQQPAPVLQPDFRPEQSSTPISGLVGNVIVVVLMVALLFLVISKYGVGPTPQPVPDDKKEQVEPQPKPPEPQPAPKVEGKTLVFVHERNPQPIEHDLMLREMPKFCSDRKLQYRALDDDLPDDPVPKLLEFAKSKGVESPFVVLTNQSDEPVRVIKWPADLAGLEELFK